MDGRTVHAMEANVKVLQVKETESATPGKKSLELLFDYTKAHIGIYVTLTGSYATLANAKIGTNNLVTLNPHWAYAALVAFVVAGMAGGTIASSITQTDATTSREFLKEKIGPFGSDLFAAKYWTWIEHGAFWVGIGCALWSFT